MELESSERVKTTLDAAGYCRLTITSANESDVGNYVCIAQNIGGSDQTDCTLELTSGKLNFIFFTFRLTLSIYTHLGPAPVVREESHEALEFVKPLKNKMAMQDEDLVLEVRIVGKPMPEMVW